MKIYKHLLINLVCGLASLSVGYGVAMFLNSLLYALATRGKEAIASSISLFQPVFPFIFVWLLLYFLPIYKFQRKLLNIIICLCFLGTFLYPYFSYLYIVPFVDVIMEKGSTLYFLRVFFDFFAPELTVGFLCAFLLGLLAKEARLYWGLLLGIFVPSWSFINLYSVFLHPTVALFSYKIITSGIGGLIGIVAAKKLLRKNKVSLFAKIEL